MFTNLRGDCHCVEALGGYEDVGVGAETNDYAGDAEEERLGPEFDEFLVFEGLDLAGGGE
jgi:hypothetical protein